MEAQFNKPIPHARPCLMVRVNSATSVESIPTRDEALGVFPSPQQVWDRHTAKKKLATQNQRQAAPEQRQVEAGHVLCSPLATGHGVPEAQPRVEPLWQRRVKEGQGQFKSLESPSVSLGSPGAGRGRGRVGARSHSGSFPVMDSPSTIHHREHGPTPQEPPQQPCPGAAPQPETQLPLVARTVHGSCSLATSDKGLPELGNSGTDSGMFVTRSASVGSIEDCSTIFSPPNLPRACFSPRDQRKVSFLPRGNPNVCASPRDDPQCWVPSPEQPSPRARGHKSPRGSAGAGTSSKLLGSKSLGNVQKRRAASSVPKSPIGSSISFLNLSLLLPADAPEGTALRSVRIGQRQGKATLESQNSQEGSPSGVPLVYRSRSSGNAFLAGLRQAAAEQEMDAADGAVEGRGEAGTVTFSAGGDSASGCEDDSSLACEGSEFGGQRLVGSAVPETRGKAGPASSKMILLQLLREEVCASPRASRGPGRGLTSPSASTGSSAPSGTDSPNRQQSAKGVPAPGPAMALSCVDSASEAQADDEQETEPVMGTGAPSADLDQHELERSAQGECLRQNVPRLPAEGVGSAQGGQYLGSHGTSYSNNSSSSSSIRRRRSKVLVKSGPRHRKAESLKVQFAELSIDASQREIEKKRSKSQPQELSTFFNASNQGLFTAPDQADHNGVGGSVEDEAPDYPSSSMALSPHSPLLSPRMPSAPPCPSQTVFHFRSQSSSDVLPSFPGASSPCTPAIPGIFSTSKSCSAPNAPNFSHNHFLPSSALAAHASPASSYPPSAILPSANDFPAHSAGALPLSPECVGNALLPHGMLGCSGKCCIGSELGGPCASNVLLRPPHHLPRAPGVSKLSGLKASKQYTLLYGEQWGEMLNSGGLDLAKEVGGRNVGEHLVPAADGDRTNYSSQTMPLLEVSSGEDISLDAWRANDITLTRKHGPGFAASQSTSEPQDSDSEDDGQPSFDPDMFQKLPRIKPLKSSSCSGTLKS